MREVYSYTPDQQFRNQRHFFGFGKKNKSGGRPGAMSPSEIESTVKRIGFFKKVTVSRVDYEGHILDATPVVITSIQADSFTGKVVNVDRELLEEDAGHAQIFIEGGGGTIEFAFHDGDIASIEEDIDNEIVATKDKSEVLEILEALDPGDEILVSYYDSSSGGFKNGAGKLIDKNIDDECFAFEQSIVNEITLSAPVRVTIDLKKSMVLDLQIQF